MPVARPAKYGSQIYLSRWQVFFFGDSYHTALCERGQKLILGTVSAAGSVRTALILEVARYVLSSCWNEIDVRFEVDGAMGLGSVRGRRAYP